MASTSSEPSTASRPTSALATLISKRTVNKKVLQQYAKKGQLDIADEDGKTPLMFACLKGLKDTVKFLLTNGANPNSKCLKDGNTPLHYACIVEESKKQDALSGRHYSPSKLSAPKIDIIKLLLGSGALAIQDNMNGWSPLCVAAFYMLKNVLDFFLAMDDAKIPLDEKIKATEILGVSQAIVAHHYCLSISVDVFDSFSRAISLRKGANLPEVQLKTSELAACFSKISLYEYHTGEELESIKESDIALRVHAFLVGDRLFPKDLKQKYLYPSLVTFGIDLTWERQMFKEGLQVLSCAVSFERLGEIKLGSVVGNLADKSDDEACKKGKENIYLQHIRDLLYEYESVLNHVHIDSLSDHSDPLVESFAEILFNEAFYCSTVDILRSTLQAIEKLVRIIRGRIRKENPGKYLEVASLTWKVMCLLSYAYICPIRNPRPLRRVRFVIRQILFFDSACSWDRNDRNTSIFLVISSLPSARHPECLESLALALVHHGYPIDAVYEHGKLVYNAKDILYWLIEGGINYSESNPQLLTSVSPPTTVLTLEEIAIRAILRHNLIYQEMLPPNLCKMIEDKRWEGLVTDSDSAADSGSDEESGSDDN